MEGVVQDCDRLHWSLKIHVLCFLSKIASSSCIPDYKVYAMFQTDQMAGHCVCSGSQAGFIFRRLQLKVSLKATFSPLKQPHFYVVDIIPIAR